MASPCRTTVAPRGGSSSSVDESPQREAAQATATTSAESLTSSLSPCGRRVTQGDVEATGNRASNSPNALEMRPERSRWSDSVATRRSSRMVDSNLQKRSRKSSRKSSRADESAATPLRSLSISATRTCTSGRGVKTGASGLRTETSSLRREEGAEHALSATEGPLANMPRSMSIPAFSTRSKDRAGGGKATQGSPVEASEKVEAEEGHRVEEEAEATSSFQWATTAAAVAAQGSALKSGSSLTMSSVRSAQAAREAPAGPECLATLAALRLRSQAAKAAGSSSGLAARAALHPS
mmetsp:Transcript_108437/g.336968  ORF Transcript_108437/g.336968 Transcript_108437/m.336968 type:complete len:295 (+) Transcript_108437:334-1218(+)